MRRAIRVPALSRELSFYLLHAAEADSLSQNGSVANAELGSDFQRAFKKVYEKAYDDLRFLLSEICTSISRKINPYAQIDWKDKSLESDWGCWGYPRRPGGRVTQRHWTGVYLDSGRGAPRIVLVLGPAGGRGGRRFFVEECRRKWSKTGNPLVLTEDRPTEWQEWVKYPCVVYYTFRMHSRSTLEEVCAPVGQAAEEFFRLAMPILNIMK